MKNVIEKKEERLRRRGRWRLAEGIEEINNGKIHSTDIMEYFHISLLVGVSSKGSGQDMVPECRHTQNHSMTVESGGTEFATVC